MTQNSEGETRVLLYIRSILTTVMIDPIGSSVYRIEACLDSGMMHVITLHDSVYIIIIISY